MKSRRNTSPPCLALTVYRPGAMMWLGSAPTLSFTASPCAVARLHWVSATASPPARLTSLNVTLAAACLLSLLATPALAVGAADMETGAPYAGEVAALPDRTEPGDGDDRVSHPDAGSTPWGAVTALLGGSAVMAAVGVFSLGRHPKAG